MESFEPIREGIYPLREEEAIALVQYGIHLESATEAKIKKSSEDKGAMNEVE